MPITLPAAWRQRTGDLPPATVIVPVKGYDEGLRENLAALAALDYPDYELIVTAHSAGDIPPDVLPARVRVVLANGTDSGASEKIQNLLAAVRASRKRTQVLAFADSDGRVTGRLAARPGGSSRRTLRRRFHRISLVPPRSPRFLVATARRLGRGGSRYPGRGRQSFRLGRRHGDPQGSVLRRPRPRVLAGRPHRRPHAQPGGTCRRTDHSLRAWRAHPVPGTHQREPSSSHGSAARWRSRASTPRGSGGLA